MVRTFLLTLLVAVALIAGCTGSESGGKNCGNEGLGKVCFEENCFCVELAVTPEERSRGLMFREDLDPDGGMLFIYEEEGIHYFWMKNTLIPLDMIWIDGNKEIIHISKDVQPCQTAQCPAIGPGEEAQYVLEVNGGTADKIGLAVGDRATFDKFVEDAIK